MQVFWWLVSQACNFCVFQVFFSHTPPFCEHSSTVHNVLDPSSLALSLWDYTHIEVCYDPAQHIMGNSPDLRSNVIFERINNLGLLA